MKNKALHDLNFKKLLEYPEVFKPQNYYEDPIPCERFCIECETSGTLAKAGGKLTLMSHGCDSSDFESILGPRRSGANDITDPIMFLLEDPGGDWGDIRKEVTYENVTKKVPTTHYYFTPTSLSWPQSIEDVVKNGNYYGTYFAYLLQKHSIGNVYITNMVKCKRDGVTDGNLVADKCISKFLEREIQVFAPKIIFCFSLKVYNDFGCRFPESNRIKLFHPHFIQNRSYTKDLSPAEAAMENDRRIEAALADAGMQPGVGRNSR